MSQHKGWKKVKYELLYQLIKGLIKLANWAPRNMLMWSFGKLGGLVYYIMPKTRDLTLKHLKYAYENELSDAEIQKIAKKVFSNLGKNFTDIVRYPSIRTREELTAVMEVEGEQHLIDAYNKGKGVILLTCHRGAFDMVGFYLSMSDYPCIAIGAKLHDEKLNDLVVKTRRHNKNDQADFVERSDPRGSIKMFKKLKDGGLAFLLIDQDTDKVQNTFVDFFGKPAATPIGAATLALKADSAIIPASIKLQSNGKHLLEFRPEVPLEKTGNLKEDIKTNTQNMSLALEKFIREAPDQWVWFHERWKTKQEEEVSNS
ncbi:lysophospholipid acyltransferase family protein [Flammeovirga sp. SubArs3]|uniref:lysophospholipid acyltransferase family protein n=1 Tax=Flammeovirga sp. SubArs3 TaxID=2995316 RepID=UPI00248BC449|nr:lysophospholipid acyltransferase family protein [Flammeovirga sp. SubArs3]